MDPINPALQTHFPFELQEPSFKQVHNPPNWQLKSFRKLNYNSLFNTKIGKKLLDSSNRKGKIFENDEIFIPQIVGFCIISRTRRLSVYKVNFLSNPLSDLISQFNWILSSLSDKVKLNHSLSFVPDGALKSSRRGKLVNDLTSPYKM